MPFDQEAAGGGGGSFWMRKLGPMPVWAWGLVGLGVAIAYASYKRNQADQSNTSGQNDVQLIGGDQTPPLVFQNYSTIITPPEVPPGGGRHGPPVPAPPTAPPGRPSPPPSYNPAPGTNPVTVPSGQWVTVAKYTSKNPPWNSTLWGIAQHFGYGSSSTNFASIWSNPQNAALVTRRKDPKAIQPGDSIFVPTK